MRMIPRMNIVTMRERIMVLYSRRRRRKKMRMKDILTLNEERVKAQTMDTVFHIARATLTSQEKSRAPRG